ncbi:conserved hypothetical protein [Desulfatibacillum aliphaticivorans]|uniref:Uncharacterized protein n=1 Tax=Desulfatibacillum aliphaticivorans TaxID=218208 RepID=B8F8U3_DESAL|nr:conserved hypothetical protein [Desulfatibacillum aliphaticivorans]
MGGQGSGSWMRWETRSTTEQQLWIDVRCLKRKGCLKDGYSGSLYWSVRQKKIGSVGAKTKSDRITLTYRYHSQYGYKNRVQQVVYFEYTPCNLGGSRPWFLCPQCKKRVAILYGIGKYFMCRNCHGLVYACQRDRKAERLMSKAQKIRRKIGADPNLSIPIMFKPKYMHQKTFDRLRFRADEATCQYLRIMYQRLGL